MNTFMHADRTRRDRTCGRSFQAEDATHKPIYITKEDVEIAES